jgi:hypothetical protein
MTAHRDVRLSENDPLVSEALAGEKRRQQSNIEPLATR